MFTDALDEIGERYFVLPLQPIKPGRIFGTVRCLSVEVIEGVEENVHEGLKFFSSLGSNHVFFVRGAESFAYFGQLMGELGERTGLAGVVVLGMTRDSDALKRGSLPVYAAGTTPVDIKGRGRVGAFDEPIPLDGFMVETGDVIFADSDGVVCFKQNSREVVESKVMASIEYEMTLSSRIRSGQAISGVDDGFTGL